MSVRVIEEAVRPFRFLRAIGIERDLAGGPNRTRTTFIFVRHAAHNLLEKF
jgi:hypothetical protein